jgi:hypothetical protein
MKKIFIFILSFWALINQAQNLPVSTNTNHDSHSQQGDYHKDLDFKFDSFIGTWIGNSNNKIFTLMLEKTPQFYIDDLNGKFHYEDVVFGKFQIATLNNIILVPFTPITDLIHTKIQSVGNGGMLLNELNLLYSDVTRCEITGRIKLIKNPSNLNELTYQYFYDEFLIAADCPYNSTNIFQLPDGQIQLVKQ